SGPRTCRLSTWVRSPKPRSRSWGGSSRVLSDGGGVGTGRAVRRGARKATYPSSLRIVTRPVSRVIFGLHDVPEHDPHDPPHVDARRCAVVVDDDAGAHAM